MGTSRDGRRLVLFGVACMVVSSLSDSVRAPALPLLAQRYGEGYGRLSAFLTAGSLGSLAFNLLAMRSLSHLSDRAVVALSALLQGGAMLAAAAAPGLGTLAAAGFVWGAGNVGLGLCANLLVVRGSAPGARARTLSALHVFYGLSCVLPPLYVGWAHRAGWSVGPLLAAPALLPLLLAGAARGLGSAHSAEEGPAPSFAGAPWGLGGVIALYVLGEVMTSMWMVAVLTSGGASLDAAGKVLSGFFLALAAGRAATAAFARPAAERALVAFGLGAGAVAAAAGAFGRPWGFAAAGACFGPVFPLLMTRLSVEHPRGLREAMAFVYAAMVVALALGHQAMGWLAERASPRSAALFPVLCVAAALGLWLAVSREKEGRGGDPPAPSPAGSS
ncbi:MAG: hypothetical protein HY928_07805 [Elusimicrobia bacterium]|nr:hypothetical protein [Elusimicrobiota bacterium]